MSPRSLLFAFTLLSSAVVSPLSAQTPAALSVERMQELMDVAKQAMNPAATALLHREALALTVEQVDALEKLSLSLKPSLDAFATISSSPTSTLSSATSGSVVDREAIRAAYVEQAERQADLVATMAEAGKQVDAILTPEQRASIEELQKTLMMEMMRSVGLVIPQ